MRLIRSIIVISLTSLFGLVITDYSSYVISIWLKQTLYTYRIPIDLFVRATSAEVYPFLGWLQLQPYWALVSFGIVLCGQFVLAYLTLLIKFGKTRIRSIFYVWRECSITAWCAVASSALPFAVLYNSPVFVRRVISVEGIWYAYLMWSLVCFGVTAFISCTKLFKRTVRIMGRCVRCHYSLNGCLGNCCPECGLHFRAMSHP